MTETMCQQANLGSFSLLEVLAYLDAGGRGVLLPRGLQALLRGPRAVQVAAVLPLDVVLHARLGWPLSMLPAGGHLQHGGADCRELEDPI